MNDIEKRAHDLAVMLTQSQIAQKQTEIKCDHDCTFEIVKA